MQRNIPLSFFILAVTTLFVADTFSNGINPPRPRGTSAITATCVEKSGDLLHTIFRARVTGGTSPRAITFRASGGSEELDIADIEAITLTSHNIEETGFSAARLMRRDGRKEELGSVLVVSKETPLEVGGFDSAGKRIDIKLSSCKTIKFSPHPGTDDVPSKQKSVPRASQERTVQML